MHPSLMRFVRRFLLLMASTACAALLAGCGGSSDETVATTSSQTEATSTASAAQADEDDEDHDDEDHDDDDHGDEDHGDEDEDHDDDDHDAEDEDHDAEDEDHDDKDHDDHGDDDEDHDDEDHDDDHDDHGDDDHDDHDDEGASGGLDAHVHGTAELLVASSGSDVVVDLISPAENIFGFEYEPSTDEDIALVEERTAVLTTQEMLVFNDQAGCALAADIESEFAVEGSHAEVTTSWLFTCAEPDELRQLDVSALLAAFPGIEDLDAQVASDSGQSAAELSASSTILQLG